MAFSDLAERVAEARGRVDEAIERGGHGQQVTIIGVTKTHGPDAVHAAWEAGLRDVGENKVQEALGKMESVDVPIRWHLIGHLQRNKVKALDRFVMLHALDSSRLADAVGRLGAESGRTVEALVEMNLSGEESKGGFRESDLRAEAERLITLPGISIRGVMTMASFSAGKSELHRTFASARAARDVLRSCGHPAVELSMGMSSDYEIAVQEGATMVRLGTTLFGARE